MEKITLDDCVVTTNDGGGALYTHVETGAWVEILPDEDPGEAPTKRGDSEMHCSYLEGSRYGNEDIEVPQFFDGECIRCKGSGYDPERYELVPCGVFSPVIAAGSVGAMRFLEQKDPSVRMFPVTCPKCKGEGTIEYPNGEAWLRATQGAIAVQQFSTGSYGEATAYMWTTCDEYTTPQEAVKAWAEEYQMWADGDCWGFRAGDSRGEEDACWGFIGRDYIKHEAAAALSSIVQDVRERVEDNIELGEN